MPMMRVVPCLEGRHLFDTVERGGLMFSFVQLYLEDVPVVGGQHAVREVRLERRGLALEHELERHHPARARAGEARLRERARGVAGEPRLRARKHLGAGGERGRGWRS